MNLCLKRDNFQDRINALAKKGDELIDIGEKCKLVKDDIVKAVYHPQMAAALAELEARASQLSEGTAKEHVMAALKTAKADLEVSKKQDTVFTQARELLANIRKPDAWEDALTQLSNGPSELIKLPASPRAEAVTTHFKEDLGTALNLLQSRIADCPEDNQEARLYRKQMEKDYTTLRDTIRTLKLDKNDALEVQLSKIKHDNGFKDSSIFSKFK